MDFCLLPLNMFKNIGKNISKNLSGKYSQKRSDLTKQSTTNAFKTVSKQAIQKAAVATGDLIGNEIDDKITKIWKPSQQNNSETVTNERNKEIPKERYIIPEQRQKVIADLRIR